MIAKREVWTREEDDLLKSYIEKHGEGKWHLVSKIAGLNRCRKSCRQRWFIYLHPSIKRGKFKDDVVDLIVRMHRLLRNRIPGRTANDIKIFWNTYRKVKTQVNNNKHEMLATLGNLIKPRPWTFEHVKDKQSQMVSTGTCRVDQVARVDWNNILCDVALDDEKINLTSVYVALDGEEVNLASGGVNMDLARYSNVESLAFVRDAESTMNEDSWDDVFSDPELWSFMLN